jgi:hypothetical protein
MVIAIPAMGGRTIAKIPARIIKTLRAMDHPNDFFKIVETEADAVALISIPP